MKPVHIYYALGVLFLINTMNFFDRQIIGAVGELVRVEWELSDSALGMLGTAFVLIYAIVGLPLGSLADVFNRSRILAGGVFVWSLLTAASGLATNFTQMFMLRLGVGVGEATCAPAASSLIGDLAPAHKRAVAFSIFMMGLPVGLALSYAVGGYVAHEYGWRAAFFVAGVPGVLCAIMALFIREPERGTTETHAVGQLRREGSPYLLVLSIPTMWWIILSGALHNFNMYAIGSFLASYMIRFHEMDIKEVGNYATFIYGLSGIPGLLLGGMLGDRLQKKRSNGRLLVGAVGVLLSVPCVFLALYVDAGEVMTFSLLMGLGCGVMYAYYSTVYSTIHDVIEPALRGTAMALYFCAMYILGASLGPVGTGFLSDYFTQSAALAAGVTEFTQQALEPFRAEGLRSAMFAIPILGALLSVVLFAGSMTAGKDIAKLRNWMENATKTEQTEEPETPEII